MLAAWLMTLHTVTSNIFGFFYSAFLGKKKEAFIKITHLWPNEFARKLLKTAEVSVEKQIISFG